MWKNWHTFINIFWAALMPSFDFSTTHSFLTVKMLLLFYGLFKKNPLRVTTKDNKKYCVCEKKVVCVVKNTQQREEEENDEKFNDTVGSARKLFSFCCLSFLPFLFFSFCLWWKQHSNTHIESSECVSFGILKIK